MKLMDASRRFSSQGLGELSSHLVNTGVEDLTSKGILRSNSRWELSS